MNSSAIMAEIGAKTAEKTDLSSVRALLFTFIESIQAAATNFQAAADLIGDAMSFDGLPADKGKTAEYANSLLNSAANFEDLANQMTNEIKALESEIATLWTLYKKSLTVVSVNEKTGKVSRHVMLEIK